MRSFDLYVALGDSMSIDTYAGAPGLGAASLLFRNDDRVWPQFRGVDLVSASPEARFIMRAEDGDTSVEMENAIDALWPEPEIAAGRTLVTITIGGNDLLTLAASPDPLGAAPTFLPALSARLSRCLERLQTLYNKPLIVLGNIYDPTDGTGVMQSGNDLSVGMPLLAAVNRLLAEIAAKHDVRLADTHARFLGHGVRHADRAFTHYHGEDPSGWYVLDIEPNARGSSEIRRLFLEAIA